MKRIPPDLLNKIKSAVSIIDIVGEHVVLRKSGANYSGLCPFHSERSPSFSVNEVKQLYHCYGCKAGGDLITFVSEINGVGFQEAIEDLASRAGMAELNLFKQFKRPDQTRFENIGFKLNRFAAKYYRDLLRSDSPSSRYLESRKIGDEIQKLFYLGASSAAWEDLSKFLVRSKAPINEAERVGLLRKSNKRVPGGSGYFDLFRSRIIFPILDLKGRVAGFGGRLIPGVDSNGPKYMNSPESSIFKKGKIAFGLYQAKKHIRESDEAILVEGFFDVLAMHQIGLKNSVATCGTALTADHIDILSRFGSKIVLLFDGDRAGEDATLRAMELGLERGVVLYGAQLPEKRDPADLVEKGEESVQTLKEKVGSATSILDIQLDRLAREAKKGTEEKSKALKTAAGWLARYSDPIGREVRVEKVVRDFGVSKRLLEQAMRTGRVDRQLTRRAEPAVQTSRAPRATPSRKVEPLKTSELYLIKALVRFNENRSILDKAGRNLPPKMAFCDLFENTVAKDFTMLLLGERGNTPGVPPHFLTMDLDPQSVLPYMENTQVRSTITEALLSSSSQEDSKATQRALGALLNRLWARFSQRLKVALSDAETRKETVLQASLLKEYLDVQRKMKELNNIL